MFISRKELEELIGKITDEQWAANVKTFLEISDEMWEEDHPLEA